ncbi:MAG: hypothetical protein ACRDQH_09570, partial [Pseudonocardiaceae bacterium]
LAPPWIPVPPPAYGGIERVVALQAAGLAAAGHDVTLVAAPRPFPGSGWSHRSTPYRPRSGWRPTSGATCSAGHVAEHFSSAAMVRSYAKLLTPMHGLRVLTPAAPMVFSAPTPAIRPLPAQHDLPRIPAAFTARRAAG